MKSLTTTLYKLGQSGLLKWVAHINDTRLVIEHGQDQGACQVEEQEYESFELAKKEYNRRIAIKMSKQGYSQRIPSKTVDLPMLAVNYSPHQTPLHVYVQPKLDGIRCVATNSTMITRRRETITSLPHIQHALQSLPPGITLDGELYCHGRSFEDHLSFIKRDEIHGLHETIQYQVFDVQSREPYSLRLLQVTDLVSALNSPFITQVPTKLIHKSEIDSYPHGDYEGLMIRDPDGLYEKDKRSKTLQKLKKFTDAEFQIVNIKAADKGRERGAAILECRLPPSLLREDSEIESSKNRNDNNHGADYLQTSTSNSGGNSTFDVRPKGSLDFRRLIYRDKESYIGLYTRVSYCGLTRNGKPKQATAEGYFSHPSKKP